MEHIFESFSDKIIIDVLSDVTYCGPVQLRLQEPYPMYGWVTIIEINNKPHFQYTRNENFPYATGDTFGYSIIDCTCQESNIAIVNLCFLPEEIPQFNLECIELFDIQPTDIDFSEYLPNEIDYTFYFDLPPNITAITNNNIITFQLESIDEFLCDCESINVGNEVLSGTITIQDPNTNVFTQIDVTFCITIQPHCCVENNYIIDGYSSEPLTIDLLSNSIYANNIVEILLIDGPNGTLNGVNADQTINIVANSATVGYIAPPPPSPNLDTFTILITDEVGLTGQCTFYINISNNFTLKNPNTKSLNINCGETITVDLSTQSNATVVNYYLSETSDGAVYKSTAYVSDIGTATINSSGIFTYTFKNTSIYETEDVFYYHVCADGVCVSNIIIVNFNLPQITVDTLFYNIICNSGNITIPYDDLGIVTNNPNNGCRDIFYLDSSVTNGSANIDGSNNIIYSPPLDSTEDDRVRYCLKCGCNDTIICNDIEIKVTPQANVTIPSIQEPYCLTALTGTTVYFDLTTILDNLCCSEIMVNIDNPIAEYGNAQLMGNMIGYELTSTPPFTCDTNDDSVEESIFYTISCGSSDVTENYAGVVRITIEQCGCRELTCDALLITNISNFIDPLEIFVECEPGDLIVVDCSGTEGGDLVCDCAGICGGSAYIDDCGECVGGNTGLLPCECIPPEIMVTCECGENNEICYSASAITNNPLLAVWQYTYSGGTSGYAAGDLVCENDIIFTLYYADASCNFIVTADTSSCINCQEPELIVECCPVECSVAVDSQTVIENNEYFITIIPTTMSTIYTVDEYDIPLTNFDEFTDWFYGGGSTPTTQETFDAINDGTLPLTGVTANTLNVTGDTTTFSGITNPTESFLRYYVVTDDSGCEHITMVIGNGDPCVNSDIMPPSGTTIFCGDDVEALYGEPTGFDCDCGPYQYTIEQVEVEGNFLNQAFPMSPTLIDPLVPTYCQVTIFRGFTLEYANNTCEDSFVVQTIYINKDIISPNLNVIAFPSQHAAVNCEDDPEGISVDDLGYARLIDYNTMNLLWSGDTLPGEYFNGFNCDVRPKNSDQVIELLCGNTEDDSGPRVIQRTFIFNSCSDVSGVSGATFVAYQRITSLCSGCTATTICNDFIYDILHTSPTSITINNLINDTAPSSYEFSLSGDSGTTHSLTFDGADYQLDAITQPLPITFTTAMFEQITFKLIEYNGSTISDEGNICIITTFI